MENSLPFSPVVAAIVAALRVRRRRRGISAKSKEARRRGSLPAVPRTFRPEVGSYRHHDALVRTGLAMFEDCPSKRSWKAWAAELTGTRAA